MCAFVDVALQVWIVAWVTLIVLVLALLAAAANYFFRNVARFDDHIREATMDLDPAARRRFFELYDSRSPKSAGVAWFLAVLFGPAGANLYRGEWFPFVAALVSLNGLGAWWLESWFTTPQLVILKNKTFSAWALFVIDQERLLKHEAPAASQPATKLPRPALVTR